MTVRRPRKSVFNGKQAALAVATSSANGYLASADWTTFNGKDPFVAAGTTLQYYRGDKSWQTLVSTAVPEGTNLYYSDVRARLAHSATAPITYTNTTGAFSMAAGTSAANGYLASADWTTFNGKQGALAVATGSANGYLSSSDWITFNAASTQWTASGSNIYRSAGNVGIGTTDPQGKVHVALADTMTYSNSSLSTGYTTSDGLHVQNTNNSDSGFVGITIDNRLNAVGSARIAVTGGMYTSALAFLLRPSSGGATTTEYMRITSTGNVGIGTTNPLTTLQVKGSVYTYGGDFEFDDAGVSDSTGVRLFSNSGNIFLQSGYGNKIVFRNKTAGNIALFNGDDNTLRGSYLSTAAVGLLTRSGNNGVTFDWDNSTLHFYVDNSNVKNFIIDHPKDPERYLVHTSLEGPEWGPVYYRGTARLVNGRAVVELPDYFESLTKAENRTITLSCVDDWSPIYSTKIKDGRFEVLLKKEAGFGNPNQEFTWLVMAERKGPALQVEPRKDEIEVKGFGPYRYYTPTK